MKIYRLNSKKGFSIVELMVVSAIFIGLMMSIFAILTSGRRAWLTSEVQIDVHASARQVMSEITRELAESAPGRVTIINMSANEDNIIFQTPDSFSGGTITWSDQIQYSLGGVNNQQFVRTNLNTGQSTERGNNIITLRFSQPSVDIVEIILICSAQSIIGDNVQMRLDSQVSLRNR